MQGEQLTPLGRGELQQRAQALGGGRGRPKPTKDVQLWDAILAATAKQQKRAQLQQVGPAASSRHPAPKRPNKPQQPIIPAASTTTPSATPAPWAHLSRPRDTNTKASSSSPAPAPALPPSKAAAGPPGGIACATDAAKGKASATTAKPKGGAPRKAKPHQHHQQRQENTNWASNQRHIAFRGKERETPKPAKPSKLKRVILLERAKADALRQPAPPPTPFPPDSPPPEAEEPPRDHQERGEQATGPDADTGRGEANDSDSRAAVGQDHGAAIKEALQVAELVGSGADFADGVVPSLRSPPAVAAAVAVEEIYYDSPPPSPPPGAAEVQSIDATYCKQIISVELNQVTRQLLQELTRFQERMRTKDPDKARSKKRYVCGLREVLRSVERKKAKCVVVTPNIERISSPEGGLFEAVEAIVRTSQQHRITVVFAMTRTSLGKAISKRLKIAALAILDPSGAEDYYKQVLALAHKGRLDYRKMHRRKSQQHVPKPLPPPHSQGQAGQHEPQDHLRHQQRQQLEEVLPELIQKVIEERMRMELPDAT